MNELNKKFGKRGLAVIGVTDESAGKVRPVVEKRGIEYLVALGGAPGYKTRLIPQAWLVSSQGGIVWEGRSTSLSESLIEQELQKVRLQPVFDLPEPLKKAEKQLNAGRLGAGIVALRKFLKKAKGKAGATATPDGVAAAAGAALKEAEAFGRGKLEAAQKSLARGFYGEALTAVSAIERSFKGSQIGKEARKQHKAWKSDKTVRAGLRAEAVLDKAVELARAKKYQAAVAHLERLLKAKALEGNKVLERAQKEYDALLSAR